MQYNNWNTPYVGNSRVNGSTQQMPISSYQQRQRQQQRFQPQQTRSPYVTLGPMGACWMSDGTCMTTTRMDCLSRDPNAEWAQAGYCV